MLAYIFWHWRSPHIDKTSYQRLTIDFHQALRTQTPRGFQYSIVFQIENTPWIGRNWEGYEEWYVVDNSTR
jgi:hypothetical protein